MGFTPHGKGQFRGALYCELYGETAVICAKTAELIDMPFGVLARMGPRNHVLDDGPDVLKDVAMATNFWTKFAIPGFM